MLILNKNDTDRKKFFISPRFTNILVTPGGGGGERKLEGEESTSKLAYMPAAKRGFQN